MKKQSINWDKNTFNPFPIDTNVFDIRFGWGIVTEIKFLDKYPVKVKFEKTVCSYTFDGKQRFSDKKAMLFRHEVKFIKA
jgi:hypothetical protein